MLHQTKFLAYHGPRSRSRSRSELAEIYFGETHNRASLKKVRGGGMLMQWPTNAREEARPQGYPASAHKTLRQGKWPPIPRSSQPSEQTREIPDGEMEGFARCRLAMNHHHHHHHAPRGCSGVRSNNGMHGLGGSSREV